MNHILELGTAKFGALRAYSTLLDTLRFKLRDTVHLGTVGLHGYSPWRAQAWYPPTTEYSSTVGVLSGWALQGYWAVVLCRWALHGRRREHKRLKSNKPTARVEKKHHKAIPLHVMAGLEESF